MSVLFFTVFVSMMLVLFFVGAFLYHHDFSGGDPLRDSLLPFGKERVRNAGDPTKTGAGRHSSAPAQGKQASEKENDS